LTPVTSSALTLAGLLCNSHILGSTLLALAPLVLIPPVLVLVEVGSEKAVGSASKADVPERSGL